MTESAGRYNIAIVGSGPGGYVAAIRACQLGAKVAIIEKDRIGGTCLNIGCIPTKALVTSAEVLETARQAKTFGVEVGEVGFNFAAIMERKQKVVNQMVSGVAQLLKANKVDIVEGTAKFATPNSLIVESGSGKREVQADNIIVATGSVSARPPLPGLDLPGVITSTEAIALEKVPERLVIIGGGYIGMEMACLYQSLGSKITIVEMLPSILTNTDEEIARRFHQLMRQRGVEINVNSPVKEIRQGENGQLSVVYTTGDGEKAVAGDKVLVATGRVPYTEGLGLEQLGVSMNRRAVVANERMQTNVPGVWAIGDATGQIMLAHVAMYQGEVAVENILGHSRKADYRAVPGVIFTMPEIGSVGLTETQTKEQGIDVQVSKFPFTANGRATTLNETAGLVKMVCERSTGSILGVHIMGPRATDLIAEAVLAIQMEALAEDLVLTIHGHPTLPEALHEAAMAQFEGPIHFYAPTRKPVAR
ncbi:MAG: dihydrolipoyl dehydrogenase [Chloroflexi bacterium]|nr:dihydrolipoyl dehydrogenase [Chloroflexota bacterium]